MIAPGPWSCEIKLQLSEVVDAIANCTVVVTRASKHFHMEAHLCTYIATCICLQYTW